MYGGSRAFRALLSSVNVGSIVAGSDDVSDQALVSRDVLANRGDGDVDGVLRRQRGLDLPQLDPEPAQLHLVVDAAEVLDLAVLRHRTRSPVR